MWERREGVGKAKTLQGGRGRGSKVRKQNRWGPALFGDCVYVCGCECFAFETGSLTAAYAGASISEPQVRLEVRAAVPGLWSGSYKIIKSILFPPSSLLTTFLFASFKLKKREGKKTWRERILRSRRGRVLVSHDTAFAEVTVVSLEWTGPCHGREWVRPGKSSTRGNFIREKSLPPSVCLQPWIGFRKGNSKAALCLPRNWPQQ